MLESATRPRPTSAAAFHSLTLARRHEDNEPEANYLSRRTRTAQIEKPILRLHLPIIFRQQWEWGGTQAELLTVGKAGPHEMEFMLPRHLVLMQCEGTSRGCEWRGTSESGKIPTVEPGSVLFNPAHHYMRVSKQARTHGRLLMLLIDTDAALRLIDEDFDPSQVTFRQQPNLNDEELRKILLTLMEELETRGPAARSCREILTLLLLTRLVRCASNLARSSHTKGGLAGWRLKRAVGWIEADLCRTPSLDELARQVKLNPTYFCSAFKQSMGVSPRHYLFQCRVARAKELMADPELTLTQIALDCGFGTLSRFSVIFKRLTGLSPSGYRRCRSDAADPMSLDAETAMASAD